MGNPIFSNPKSSPCWDSNHPEVWESPGQPGHGKDQLGCVHPHFTGMRGTLDLGRTTGDMNYWWLTYPLIYCQYMVTMWLILMVNIWLMMVNNYIWLVVGFNPSEKWWTSEMLGWWHSQYDGKVIKFHGSSHHQPDMAHNWSKYLWETVHGPAKSEAPIDKL